MKHALPTALFLIGASTFSAQAQTPFPAGSNVVISKPGTNSAAKIYTIYTNTNAASGTFTQGITFTPLYNINGIGLNAVDNFVYGAAYTGNTNNIGTAFNISLFRIGANGVQVDLGVLPLTGALGSGSLEFVNFSAGTVSLDGKYYYMTYAITPAAFLRISGLIALGQQPDLTAADLKMYICWKSNINTMPSNPGGNIASVSGFYEIDFSNPSITASTNAFLTQVNANYPNVFDADGGVQDFAINPLDAKLYGYVSYPSGTSVVGRPMVINAPVAGVAVAAPVGTTVNTVPGQEAAGVQFDATGNFYTLFTTGGYAQVNLTTGALVGLTASNIATTGGNLRGDLASTLNITPLNTEFISFSGKNNGTTNELNWITASEINNNGFSIERSENLNAWTAIGFEASKATDGRSNQKLTYNFTDKTPVAGTEYYRLKQVNRDDKATYSTVISIASTNTTAVNVYPNPTGENVKIDGLASGNTIRLYDMTGRTLSVQKAEGNTATISLAGLTPNIYMIQVADNNKILYTGKVSKK
jgi:hypothetical protein